MLLLNVMRGTQVDFLSTMFLYPSIYAGYGAAPNTDILHRLAYRLSDLSEVILASVPLCMTALPGAVAFVMRFGQVRTGSGAVGAMTPSPGLAVLLVTVGMLIMLVISPVLWDSHALPFWVVAAVFGGEFARHLYSNLSQSSSERTGLAQTVALLGAFLIVLPVSVWQSNGRTRPNDQKMVVDRVGDTPGQYAYVFGVWPELYFSNKLIPASSVLYPPLAGAQLSRHVVLREFSESKRRLLDVAAQNAGSRLMSDFRYTPPRFIVVIDPLTRGGQAGSELTGYGPMDKYLVEHCEFSRDLNLSRRRIMEEASLFNCN